MLAKSAERQLLAVNLYAYSALLDGQTHS